MTIPVNEPFSNPIFMEKVKIASSILSRVQNTVRQYVVAIAGMISHTEGEVEGTGTIIELGGRVLLLTAEHVVSQIEAKAYEGIAFSNGDKKAFSCVRAPFVKNTAIDVAYVRIPQPQRPDSDREVCPERSIASSARVAEKDLLFIHGFPGNDSKFWTLLKGIQSKPLTFAAYSGMSKDPAFNPVMQLALSYEPKHCIGIDGEAADWPMPDGLSGSAVWKIPRLELEGTWAPDGAQLVGIVQKWDPDGQCLIAMRIEHILPFLRSSEDTLETTVGRDSVEP
jgi:hypothetical protein